MTIQRLNAFVDMLEERNIASRASLVGCSAEEIARLETRYGIVLPASYRWYLETMGHQSGRLFTHDHLAVFYPYVLQMTDEERQDHREEGEESRIELPADALIIAGRLGEQFQFIRCNNPDDSPIWYYNVWDLEIRQVHATLLEWLQLFAAEAQEAIANGYYDMFPDGTRP